MRKLVAVSVASTLLGYVVVHFVFFSKSAPVVEPESQATVVEPSEPVVLAQVVDVTDLEPLLSPAPIQPEGVPFDPSEPLEVTVPVTAPAPIPPAAD